MVDSHERKGEELEIERLVSAELLWTWLELGDKQHIEGIDVVWDNIGGYWRFIIDVGDSP